MNTTDRYPCAYAFPHPNQADPDGHGMIAMGGDLAPTTLLHAYSKGLFPWFSDDEPIAWWSPDPRCVFYPDDFSPKKSLKKSIKKSPFTVSLNASFDAVIDICATIRAASQGTWITEDMIEAYSQLHQHGYAHSIEVWSADDSSADDAEGSSDPTQQTHDQLVGGLYGIKLGNAFFGESMFHKRTDASKMAFSFLMKLAKQHNMALVDGQLENPHLMRLGAVLIDRDDFLDQLTDIMRQDTPDWSNLNGKHFDVSTLLDASMNYR